MAETGIRTTNLPLVPLLEVIGHSDNGNGQPGAVGRQKMSDFVQALLALAGLDPSGVADLAGQLNELATQLAGETDDRIAGDASVTFTGDRPLIWDVTGIYGTPQTLYVPRNFYFQKGAAAYNGPGGIESAAMPGYIAFGNISPTLATTIYMDLDAQYPYQLVTYPNQVPQGRVERVVVLATLYNGQVVTNLPVSYADGQSGTASFLAPLSPLVIEENPQDGNLLLVPRLFYFARGVSNGFEPYGPPAGQSHWAVSIPADPLTDVRYFFNLKLAKAGQSPIVAVTGDHAAMFGDARVILLGHSIGGVFSPAPGVMAVGSALGGLAKNQCTISLNADGARYLYNSTKIDAVTEPVLINLGFLRGARDVTNKRPYYGEDLVSAIPDGSLWFRFYVQTDVAGDFGNPTIFINDLASGNPIAVASLNAGTIRQEYTRSPKAASFIGRLDLPPAISGPCYISVGSDNPNGRDLIITGLQYAVTRERLSWIGRLDLDLGDADRELAVLGQDIFLIQGQRLPLRVQNGFAARPRQISLVSCLTSLPASPGGSMYTAQGAPDLVLEADRVGPTGTLSMRSTANAIDLRAEVPLRFWVSPSSGLTGSPKILLIGDSLTNRRIGAFLNAKLTAMGLTPTFLGTMPSAGLTDTDWGNATGGPLGEGREGWQFADFTYQNTRFDPIGQAGQTTVAQYSAMTKGGMNGKNPFVIPSGAGANVYNGYKFDFPTYLSRFGIATPDFVVITLAQNDEALAGSAAAATQQVVNGLNAMVSSIRGAGVNIQIGIGLHTRPRAQTVDPQFALYRYPNLKAIASFVRASGDPKLAVLPFWQHMDENAPWTMAQAIVPNSVGLARTYFADQVHFGDEQRHVVAELIRAWIAKGLTGGTAYTPEYLIQG